MSDWMISKKRYYGLALPIWTCDDCDAWEVIGSPDDPARARRCRLGRVRGPLAASAVDRRGRDRVRARAAAGRGASSTSATRGWTPASWASRRSNGPPTAPTGRSGIPADFVTESFPGQFRNWFYALITESTVMTGQAPFKTLFGYALLRDEHGEEMHKSKGNAIWFDEAAEQHRRGRHALDVLGQRPGQQHELRLPPGPRGGAPLLPAALEHVRLLRHLRAA